MKKRLVIIFILMSICVAGITALQLYYSYGNYEFAKRVFIKDANDALLEARDSSIAAHIRGVEEKFVIWMNDTTFVKITCRYNKQQHSTVFTIKEVKPYTGKGQTRISMSVDEITEKADSLTPQLKNRFIDNMVATVHGGLKKGTVLFFTQGLGDSLSKAYYKTPIDQKIIEGQYRRALSKRGIDLRFSFLKKLNSIEFCTDNVNISVDKPRWMQACFTGVEVFLLGKLKWVIIGSLVLIIITLACFWYTARTLLSQHKLNRMKDEFISNMTHEIHTPLASLLVTAEALRKFSHDEETRNSYIDIVLHQGGRLSALTDEILNRARLDKKGIVLDETIEIKELLAEIISDYRGVTFEPLAASTSIIGNRFHLGNAIHNLLDNAVKYNTAANPVVKVYCELAAKHLMVFVADNGPGIPDNQKEKIFGQFYRIPSGNVHYVKGYGLGLSYVKKVAGAHNGTISVKDNQPTGAIFILKLPV